MDCTPLGLATPFYTVGEEPTVEAAKVPLQPCKYGWRELLNSFRDVVNFGNFLIKCFK